MAEMEKRKNSVIFQKEIVTEGPDAYAAARLEFEGLPEERTEQLRNLFNGFYKTVEQIVIEETPTPQAAGQAQGGKRMCYKNGRAVWK